jgi:hypothetical protein
VTIHDSEAFVCVYFVIKDGKFQYFTGSQPIGEYRTIDDIDNNTWYHVKIEFDIFDWHLWINDISQDNGIGYGFWGENASDFDKVSFTQYDGNGEYLAYIDAVGFSWDPDYKIGDNLNEGLLLRYENSTNLDWTGYSIDGGTNITISGSTIIPLRSEGLHTIQLFGNDTQGVWHFSNLRYFTYNSTLQADMIHVMDYTYEDGLYFELLLNTPGTFNYSKSDSCFPSVNPMPNAIYYCWFRVFDYRTVENDLILESITIRFFYDDPQDYINPSLLALYRYDEVNSEWVQINVDRYYFYFEITLNDLSYFCVVRNPILPPQPIPIGIIIIILCTVVVAILSIYIIFSKYKKNKILAKAKVKISPSEPKVILCLYCGHEMDSRFEFCDRCGARLEQGDEDYPLPSEPSSQKKLTIQVSADQEPISKESIEEDPEQVSNKQDESIQKDEIYEKAPIKKKKITEQKKSEKSIEVLREIEKTEREIHIQEREALCQVHKGPLMGITYRCPKCRTMYCLKCANALKENGEGCWICNSPINIVTQSVKAEKLQEDIQDPISHNKLREIFKEGNAIEKLKSMGNLNITLLSKDFLEKVDQFDWSLEEKRQFIKEMIGLTRKEREDILNEIIHYKNTNE